MAVPSFHAPVAAPAPRSTAERPAKSPAPRAAWRDTRPAAAQLAQLAAVVNPNGLPANLQAGIERLSGHSLADVRVHRNSSQPAQLNAHAFAQGRDIHLAPGQEKHLPHEAWHVVQQAQGRVQPTMQLQAGGTPINDDHGLEREADVMGAQALQMARSAGRAAGPARPAAGQGKVIQAWGLGLGSLTRNRLSLGVGTLAAIGGAVALGPVGLLAGAAGLMANYGLKKATNESTLFSEEMRGQQAFHQSIDAQLDATTTHPVSPIYGPHLSTTNAGLTAAGQRLRERELRQRALVQSAHAGGRDIYDGTIQNHRAKNALWRQWMQRVGQGTKADNTPVDADYTARVGTTLARMIATQHGHRLMQHLHTQSGALNVPIRFNERTPGAPFNMTAGADLPADRSSLRGIDVSVPAAGEYHDAQSFKRANHPVHGVMTEGTGLTAAPLDTDLFHEFVHASHYMAMEQRRQALPSPSNRTTKAGKAKARRDRAAHFQADNAAYHGGIGGMNPVLGRQDNLAEASTIHRRGSVGDIRAAMDGERLAAAPQYRAGYQGSIDNIDRMQTIIANNGQPLPAENDYRAAIGLRARQDHRGVSLNGANYDSHLPTEGVDVT